MDAQIKRADRTRIRDAITNITTTWPLTPDEYDQAARELRAVWRQVRHATGLARFERECHIAIVGRRRVKAYRVAGTLHHGMYAALFERTCRAFRAAAAPTIGALSAVRIARRAAGCQSIIPDEHEGGTVL